MKSASGEVITYSASHMVCAKSLQSCLTLCHPMDHSLPSSSVQGLLQARILEWVAMPSCSHPGIESTSLMSPALAGRFFTTSATLEAQATWYVYSQRFQWFFRINGVKEEYLRVNKWAIYTMEWMLGNYMQLFLAHRHTHILIKL